jgi:hypothetical protein
MPNSQGENMRNLFDLWCIGFFRISNPLHLGSGLQIPNSGRLHHVRPKAMKHLFPYKSEALTAGEKRRKNRNIVRDSLFLLAGKDDYYIVDLN